MRLLPLLAIAVALPATARAGNFGTPTLTLMKKLDDDRFERMNEMERLEFFNDTACRCHSTFGVQVTLPGAGGTDDRNVETWVGLDCPTVDNRTTRCRQVDVRKVSEFFNNVPVIEIDAADLMFPPSSTCSSKPGTATVWLLIDEDGNGTFEDMWSLPVSFDAEPPVAPTNVTSTPVEDGISLEWDVAASGVTNIRSYQVLCASSIDGSPILEEPASEPEYTRQVDVEDCNASASTPDAGTTVAPDAGVPAEDAGTPVVDAGTPDAGATGMLADFEALDPRYICSDVVGRTSQGERIDLSDTDNVIPFLPTEKIKTKVVAIDTARNFSAVDGPDTDLPQPVRDAWETYHDRGGSADGGFCFVATAVFGDYDHPYVRVLRAFRDGTLAQTGAGRAFIRWYYAHSPAWADFLRAHPVWRGLAAAALFPVVALAWMWNGVGLGGVLLGVAMVVAWRRRRRLATALAVLAVIAATARPASAQVFLEEGVTEEVGPPKSSWAFEFKLGPYFPDIDGESGLTGNPYAETFGDGSSLLFQMELDRFFLHPAGELGLGASIGYMGNSAKAFATDDSGMSTGMRSADTTSFKMLPLALLVVYRMTLLADRTVVPLVPYAKLGLSYYAWQITKGNGDLADVAGDEARGGTLGFQAALGLAVRADAFDRGAQRSLQSELGVEHVGFFFELVYANVSGLGMSNRLHLGDVTWSAGLNFEF